MRWVVPHRLWSHVRPVHTIERFVMLVMSLCAGMLALGGMILFDARADAWHHAEQTSTNLALALADNITRTVNQYDLSIQSLRDVMARPNVQTLDPELRQMVLFDRAANAAYLDEMVAMDENGNIIADARSTEPREVDLIHKDYFQVHREHTDIGLFVSRPHRSRTQDGDPHVAFSRRITHLDGTFGGVVFATLRLAYFSNLFGKFDLGSNGSATLFRSDGRIIMQLPYREADIDQDLGNTTSFRRYMDAESGTIADDVDKFYAFRHLPGLPLVLRIAVSMDDLYAAWWHKALAVGGVLSLLCGMSMTAIGLFRREFLCRTQAENALRDTAEQMALSATTDALTGLANRRAFEARLSQEWLRSIRAEMPIALFMLDIDHFKRFNDQYGHPAGDDALRSIASCIASKLMRPGDLGARYGGEEFAVLLPETESAGAMIVAERIRSAVTDLGLRQAENPDGHITISIGVAVAYPMVGDSSAAIVNLADRALYAAKHGGRNRINAMESQDALLTGQSPTS